MTKNPTVLKWLEEMKELLQPEKVVWVDGTDAQRDELRALFEEFEAGKSPEARFAKVMDNFQPLLLNNSNGGADWREHKVSRSKVVGRQLAVRISEELNNKKNEQ